MRAILDEAEWLSAWTSDLLRYLRYGSITCDGRSKCLREALRRAEDDLHPCVGADVGQSMPLIHAEFSNADLNIQSIVVIRQHSPLRQVIAQHILMRVFTAFNLCQQSPLRLGKIAHRPSSEALPPLLFLRIRTERSFSRADADEDADLAPWPFVDRRFIEKLWRRIELAIAFINKDGLSDLDGFEC